MQKQQTKLNAVIFGASGAVGSALLKNMVISDNWGKIYCVVREMIPEWKQLQNKDKVYFHLEPQFQNLRNPQEWIFEGYDAMFMCLGTDIKKGEEQFIKVDKTFPLLCADLALRNKIPHFLYISTTGADFKSKISFVRVKGETELQLIEKRMNLFTVIRPGVIKDRPHQRTFQTIAEILAFVHVLPSIQCNDVALALMGIAQKEAQQSKKCPPTAKIYQNKDILNFLGKQE